MKDVCQMKRFSLLLCVVLAALELAACGAGFVPRQRKAEVMAAEAGWSCRLAVANMFDLVTCASPGRVEGGILVVYVEGDGLAFLGPHAVSADPTPREPAALQLALRDPRAAAAYVARPCQYTMAEGGRNCVPAYWTGGRYAPEVVASMGAALDIMKREAGAAQLVLAGYSGGGAMAVLLAAARSDVAGIVTVGANLDLAFWTGREGLTPLDGSLDPAQVAAKVQHIPQVHFTGEDDEVVAPAVAYSYLSHMTDGSRTIVVVVPGFDHDCCWVDRWHEISARPELASIPGW